MSPEPSGSTVLDTSVLLELAVGSPSAEAVKAGIAEGRIHPLTGELNVLELRYIICRRAGAEQGARSVGFLTSASQFGILPSSAFLEAAAKIKCERAMSLVDCVTIAMGESLEVPVLFSVREKEIDGELKKRRFKTDLRFLRDSPSER
jgi:predicted nucleic acid-binding protein